MRRLEFPYLGTGNFEFRVIFEPILGNLSFANRENKPRERPKVAYEASCSKSRESSMDS